MSINSSTKFYEVKSVIFNSHCDFFIHSNEGEDAKKSIKEKLKKAFKDYKSDLKAESFIYTDNKNPAPKIIENILKRFGVKSFFKSINGSDLDLVFENERSKTEKLRNSLLRYLLLNTRVYPYTTDVSFYHPLMRETPVQISTIWEDFLDDLLKERHNIVHGHTLSNPYDHDSLYDAKLKVEILIYAFTINICVAANPVFILPESNTL